jgi:hypothetical protein
VVGRPVDDAAYAAPANALDWSRVNPLADITLPDHDGEPVRLGSLWSDGPVALVWLRHYG